MAEQPTTTNASNADDSWMGRVFGGAYRIEARLGAGAMGTVYAARHGLLDQVFALKILDSGASLDAEARRRFLVEARSLAAFTHKNAVQVRHCGEEHGVLYLVMDFVPGETLASRLAQEGSFAPARAVEIALSILDALGEAHAAGIVHRDVKPGNVMVESVPASPAAAGHAAHASDRVRVLDFGLARMVGGSSQVMPSAFASLGGQVVGTVAYMAPEQLRAEDEVDGRSDLFAVGVVLYEMLVGVSPFPGNSTMSIALRIVEKPPAPWPTDWGAEVSIALRHVVERALEKDPERRFASAQTFAAALRAAMVGIEPEPLPPAPIDSDDSLEARKPARGRRVAIAALVALAALAGGGLWLNSLGPSGEEVAASRYAAAAAAGWKALEEARARDAVEAFSEAIAIRPREGLPFLGRGEARTLLEDSNARLDLDEARRLRPEDPDVAVALAQYLWDVIEDEEGAEEAWRRALVLDDHHLGARFARARAALDKQNLGKAGIDIAVLQRAAPSAPETHVLRARQLVSMAQLPDEPDAEAKLEEARAAGELAAAADDRWAMGAAALAEARTAAALHAKQSGRHELARELLAEGEKAASEALVRARQWPRHRRQAQQVKTLLRLRAGVRFAATDVDGAFADLDALLALAPLDARALSMRAYAAMETGRFAEAVSAFKRLYELTGDPDVLFRHAFGLQRQADVLADRGARDEARLAYDEAIAVYRLGREQFPESMEFATYLGEVLTMRSRVVSAAERRENLEAAGVMFDLAVAKDAEDGEARLRRAEWALEQRRADAALADLRYAIGERHDRTPRYYARWAQAALLAAEREGLAQTNEAAMVLLDEALVAVRRAREVGMGGATNLLLLEARIQAGRAHAAGTWQIKLEAMNSAIDTLATVEREFETIIDAQELARVRAQHAFARAHVEGGREALAAALSAVALRDAEVEAGRWFADPLWFDVVATLAERVGDTAVAEDARRRAARLRE